MIILLTTDEFTKDWGPGGDGSAVRVFNLPLSALACFPPSNVIEELWEEEYFLSSISIWEEKLVFGSETLLDTCWAIVVVPLADVRLVVEDEVDLN